MAKRRNKSAKIREVVAELGPDVTAAQIVEVLAARRVRVSPQQVYNVRNQGQARPTKAKAGGYDSLIQAKKLVDALGGIDRAKAALETLAKLL